MATPLDLEHYLKLAKQAQPFTDSDARLHEYIVKHFGELSYYGIIDLAQKTALSKATIGRFLNKLGFTGYAAFKHALRSEIHINPLITPVAARRSQRQLTPARSDFAALQYIENTKKIIDSFSTDLDIHALDTLAKKVSEKHRTVYIVGAASSRAMAMHFANLLKYSRTEIVFLNLDKGELSKALLGLKQDDLLLAFSYYRFNPVVVDIIRYFNRKQAHVSVITNSKSHPYGKYSNNVFVLPSEVDAVFHSRIVGFLFIELLLVLIQQHLEEDNFEELEELFEFFGTFSGSAHARR